MILRRHRRFTVNMGDYESYSFGADVELSNQDLGITDEQVLEMSPAEHTALRERLTEAVLAELDEQLIGEVQEAAELTDHQRSFILRSFTTAKPSNAKPKSKPTTKPRKASEYA